MDKKSEEYLRQYIKLTDNLKQKNRSSRSQIPYQSRNLCLVFGLGRLLFRLV